MKRRQPAASAPPLEELPPPPRQVRRRAGHGCFLGCVHLFILPHTLIGVFLLYQAVQTLVLALLLVLLGSDVPGRVTGLTTTRGSKGSVSYHVEFTYRVDDTDHTARRDVSAHAFDALHEGDEVAVRIGPGSEPVLHVEGDGQWKQVGGAWFAALFWNGIVSVFLWFFYVRPLLLRRLVSIGLPTTGRILAKEVSRGKTTSYHVRYRYHTPPAASEFDGALITGDSSAVEREGKMEVRMQDHDAAVIGEVVTVLYDPRRPKRSLIYQFADYEAVPT